MKDLVILSLAIVLFFTVGCAGVNRGLDNVNRGAREVGKPVGKVMNIPGSAAEGAAEGIITTSSEDNPFGR